MEATERTCPECGKTYPATKRLCIDCGVDLVTGRKLDLADAPAPAAAPKEDDPFALEEDAGPVVPPPPPLAAMLPASKLMPAKANRPPREPLAPPTGIKKLLYRVGEYFPGLFHLSTLISGIILMIVGLGLWGLGLFWFFIGATFEGIMACSMGLFAQLQALTVLIGGTLEILHEALSGFTKRQWTTFFICWLSPFLILFCVGMIFFPELSRTAEKDKTEQSSESKPKRTNPIKEFKELQERARNLGGPSSVPPGDWEE